MDSATREATFVAVAKANRHLSSARANLLGQRVPLAGLYCNVDKVFLELSAALQDIAEAIRLIERSRAWNSEHGHALSHIGAVLPRFANLLSSSRGASSTARTESLFSDCFCTRSSEDRP